MAEQTSRTSSDGTSCQSLHRPIAVCYCSLCEELGWQPSTRSDVSLGCRTQDVLSTEPGTGTGSGSALVFFMVAVREATACGGIVTKDAVSTQKWLLYSDRSCEPDLSTGAVYIVHDESVLKGPCEGAVVCCVCVSEMLGARKIELICRASNLRPSDVYTSWKRFTATARQIEPGDLVSADVFDSIPRSRDAKGRRYGIVIAAAEDAQFWLLMLTTVRTRPLQYTIDVTSFVGTADDVPVLTSDEIGGAPALFVEHEGLSTGNKMELLPLGRLNPCIRNEVLLQLKRFLLQTMFAVCPT